MESKAEYHPFGVSKPTRRQEILRIASELFSQHGLHAVTTRQIATKVGISQPSLYAHFASLQQIQEELSANAFTQLEISSRKALESGLTAHDQLRAAIKNYFEFGLGNPVAYRIAFMIEYPEKAEMTQGEYEAEDHPGPRAFANMKMIVAMVRPDIDAGQLDILSKSLWATLHGLIALILARGAFPWGDKDQLIAEHSRLAFNLVLNF